MNEHTGDLATSSRIAGLGDGQVNQRAWLFGQAVELSRRLMAQHRLWPGPQQRRPQLRLSRHLTREGCVHPTLNPLPVRSSHPMTHRVRVEPELGALRSRDDTV